MKELPFMQPSIVGRLCIAMLIVAVTGCAGPERPKPKELSPNPGLMSVKSAWTANIGSVDFPLDARIVDNKLYVANGAGTVAAIDARTGGDVWRTDLNTRLAAGVGSDGRWAAVVSRTNELIVLDAGKEVWRQRLSGLTLTAPLVAGARVFTVAGDRAVSAFDVATGRRLWQQQRAADALVLGQSGVLFAVGDTLVTGMGGRLVGMNPLNGSTRWEVPIGMSRGTNEVERLVDLVSGASRQADQVCVRAFQSNVACVDAGRGRLDWNKPAVGSSGLAGDATMVVGVEGDSKVIAYQRTDGERLWMTEQLRFRGLSGPLVVGRAVVAGDENGLIHFLSKVDGSPLHRVSTDGSAIVGAPLLSGANLIVLTRRGSVLAYKPE